jgi:eukaryotic-like serine/threonine-protein kinase
MPTTTAQLLATLSPLLERALDMAPQERAAWLAELGQEHPGVAQELKTLLEQESELETRGFLQEGVWRNPESLTQPLAGRRVGAYTLARPIGQGGMGTVWLAARSDGRYEGEVAVKLLNLALLDPVGSERFRREGEALARLTHPNIARLIDAGVTGDGQPFLVLEHVAGTRIDRYCDEHGLPLPQRIGLFEQVLAAVAHAHANLIVHRDLKPSNILVTADGTVKLLDFGIAKLLVEQPGSTARTELTEAGGRPFTPEYAAPEQVTGGVITTGTDVYGLGVLLYLLLAGSHPTGPGDLSRAERLRAIVETEPPRLSSAVQGIGDLDNIVAKALEKEVSRRYPTVLALADDLGRYLRHEPVLARTASLGYRVAKFVRRNRAAVAAAGMILATLLGATAFSTAQMREARWQRDAAVYEQRRADAQVEFQQLMLNSLGTGRVTMREIIDQGKVLLAEEYSGDPRVAASIALSLGGGYELLGELGRQLEMVTLAESLAIAAGEPDIVMLSRCTRAYNLAARELGAHASALVDSLRPAIRAAAPGKAAACMLELAAIELRGERFDSAAAIGRRAAALLESAGDTTGMDYIDVLDMEASALENLKRRREALAIYQRLADLMDRTGRGQTSTRNVIRNNIGIALSNLGEMTLAEPILRETLETHRRGDPDGVVHPAILVNYCRTVLFLQKLDTAAAWYQRLLTQSVARQDVAMEGDAAHGLAEVALASGELDEAARWIGEEQRVRALGPEGRPGTSIALDAALAHARGDLATAKATFTRALRQMGYFDGGRTYQMRSVLIGAAKAARDAGNPAEAVEYARAAADIASSDALSETRSAYVGEARLIEGTALLAGGDTAAARAVITRAVGALRAGAGAEHPRAREAERLLASVSR